MIDDKKIEKAAFDLYRNDKLDFVSSESVEGFKAGANWAIGEFIKDLWHSASEEPRKDVSIMVETYNDNNMFYYVWNRWQDNFYPSWTDAVLCSRVSRWLYVGDLFPKEGGNHD